MARRVARPAAGLHTRQSRGAGGSVFAPMGTPAMPAGGREARIPGPPRFGRLAPLAQPPSPTLAGYLCVSVSRCAKRKIFLGFDASGGSAGGSRLGRTVQNTWYFGAYGKQAFDRLERSHSGQQAFPKRKLCRVFRRRIAQAAGVPLLDRDRSRACGTPTTRLGRTHAVLVLYKDDRAARRVLEGQGVARLAADVLLGPSIRGPEPRWKGPKIARAIPRQRTPGDSPEASRVLALGPCCALCLWRS